MCEICNTLVRGNISILLQVCGGQRSTTLGFWVQSQVVGFAQQARIPVESPHSLSPLCLSLSPPPTLCGNLYFDVHSYHEGLHSHQQWIRFSAHFYTVLSFVFLVMAILTKVRWNLRAFLLCISLMIKDVKQIFIIWMTPGNTSSFIDWMIWGLVFNLFSYLQSWV